MSRDALPIDAYLPEVAARLRERRALVLAAAPGAGKTTRLPPALVGHGPVLVLQPRRVAARSVARRIAGERGWTVGREAGWHVRFERQFSRHTRVLVATEGILTARLQQDPLLSDFRTVVLDEFHERSIHTDLGLALVRQAWLARRDLQLVVMSATLDVRKISEYLDDAPVLKVPGAAHPVEVRYSPGTSLEDAVAVALRDTEGSVLCFLPGAPEIRRVLPSVARIASARGGDVVPLYGGLAADDQDAAMRAVPHRRVILATNIAETSLTVPGVRAVVDLGLQKVARYDPARAVDRLTTERVSQDAADQRAGRAGRLGPGLVWRLWGAADRLRSRIEPEIHRVDLAGPALDVVAWGEDPRTFGWYEPPSGASLDAALALLRRLGALDGSGLTPLGRRMKALPLHPRLARILIGAGCAREAALGCALLSERHAAVPARGASSCDLLSAIADEARLPGHVVRVARELERICGGGGPPIDEAAFRRALLAGYPDRVARRRAPGSPRVLLASGHGAAVGPESGVHGGEFVVALDVLAAPPGEGAEARIRLASVAERDWLTPDDIRIDHELDAQTGTVRAVERELYGAVVLSERPVPPDPAQAAELLADAYLRRGLRPEDEQLLRRLRFCGMEISAAELVRAAATGSRSLKEVDLDRAVGWDVRQAVDRDAPMRLVLPSGRSVRLEYLEDGGVMAEVKLQELFGVRETPQIGVRRQPVLLALLAPNGRPVQLTRDLRSFWENTYAEVRRELRGRYPKHRWPEHP